MLAPEVGSPILVCNLCGRIIKAKSKMHNVGQTYNGRWYQSGLEAAYAMELDLRKEAGEIVEWRPQVKIPLTIYGRHVCDYYVDFEVTHKDGTVEYVETKGWPSEVWKLKWQIFEATYNHEHPEIELTIVK
jgi:hypothetical protein